MISTTRVCVLLACLILIDVTSSAQISPRKQPTSKPPAERQSLVQIQRSMAVQMITSLADEADRYKDETLRAQIQARAADTLWDQNPDYSRELFRRAWKAAESVDRENERLTNETRAKAIGSRDGGLVMLMPTGSVRMEVLKLAATRDTELAEDLLKKISEVKEEDKESTASRDNNLTFDPTEPTVAIAKRLEIATILLEKDPERAIAFAAPALNDATSPGIIFLCTLRRKDRDVADKLYAQMLSRAGEDLKSDATSVSLLSSYLFTPNLLVTATKHGRIMNPFADDKQPADYSPVLRLTFFRIAAGILLRPAPPLNQDTTSAGRAGTYFTIARLLPLFEQYAPSSVAALKTQMLMLAADVPESWKSEDDLMLRAGLVPTRTTEKETFETLEQQLAKASNSAERDLLYLKAIQKGSGSGDLRIRDLAGKIEDANLREQARTFADLAIVRSAINTRDSDRVLRIVREGYLSPLHRVWALATIASPMGKTDLIRALDVLSDATAEAMRIRVGDPSRVYALVCVAQSSIELDRVKAETVAFDVIKSVNAVTDFNSEGGKLYAQVRSRNLVAMINSREQSFNMASLFERLSKQNLQLAISLANDVKPDAPRAAATLAIAGLILKGQTGAVSLRE